MLLHSSAGADRSHRALPRTDVDEDHHDILDANCDRIHLRNAKIKQYLISSSFEVWSYKSPDYHTCKG